MIVQPEVTAHSARIRAVRLSVNKPILMSIITMQAHIAIAMTGPQREAIREEGGQLIIAFYIDILQLLHTAGQQLRRGSDGMFRKSSLHGKLPVLKTLCIQAVETHIYIVLKRLLQTGIAYPHEEWIGQIRQWL